MLQLLLYECRLKLSHQGMDCYLVVMKCLAWELGINNYYECHQILLRLQWLIVQEYINSRMSWHESVVLTACSDITFHLCTRLLVYDYAYLYSSAHYYNKDTSSTLVSLAHKRDPKFYAYVCCTACYWSFEDVMCCTVRKWSSTGLYNNSYYVCKILATFY